MIEDIIYELKTIGLGVIFALVMAAICGLVYLFPRMMYIPLYAAIAIGVCAVLGTLGRIVRMIFEV
jgi:hypothetical protein